jgi:L-asparaginase
LESLSVRGFQKFLEADAKVVGGGVVPSLDADELISGLPTHLLETLDIRAVSVVRVTSNSMSFVDVFQLRDSIKRELANGADGIVVTHGTDTLEETAYALDLMFDAGPPIIFTGAMRNPTLNGCDGASNLAAAVAVAACDDSHDMGVLVTLNDVIHCAQYVCKQHTSSLGAFQSVNAGPVGWLAEGEPRIVMHPHRRHQTLDPDPTVQTRIPIIMASLGDDGELYKSVRSPRFTGLVLAGFGGGHLRHSVLDDLTAVISDMPVVLASRTGSGETLRHTYSGPGAEKDLLDRGIIFAGRLDPAKARIMLLLAQMSRYPTESLPLLFNPYSAP